VTSLLDTHVLVWWLLNDRALPARFAEALDRAAAEGRRVGTSAISLWEIAMLAALGRLKLTGSIDALLQQVEAHPMMEVLPLTARVAVESTRLGPSFPRDPADRIIAATTRCHGLALMTADEAIRASGVVAVV
jgi:PIN domain nuclease of toxin-antitoxin system